MPDNSHNEKSLLVALELSNKKWGLAFSNGEKIRQRTIEAGDLSGFLREVRVAKEKLDLSPESAVTCCYEAGRDGFWIYRWLLSRDLECRIVDPASIEVTRRKRRKKTDRLDAASLVRLLKRYEEGDKLVWSVVCVPSEKEEDELRLHRELDRMKKERSAHRNRIKSLLCLHGIKMQGNLLTLRSDLDELPNWEGVPLPEDLRKEIERELLRLELVAEQIKEVEQQKRDSLKKPETNAERVAADLIRLHGVGEVSAWDLSKEFFGWRKFKNRREVASLAGLTPTPYNSGSSERELGISKAGNPRVRKIMIELAWGWLRFQPNSELSKWFERRFGQGSKRMRRVGITALARKLLVALWKYTEFGIIPEGACVR